MKNLLSLLILITALSFTSKPYSDEKVYTLKLTATQISIIYNGLNSSNGSHQEIQYIISEMDKQLRPQLVKDSVIKKK